MKPRNKALDIFYSLFLLIYGVVAVVSGIITTSTFGSVGGDVALYQSLSGYFSGINAIGLGLVLAITGLAVLYKTLAGK